VATLDWLSTAEAQAAVPNGGQADATLLAAVTEAVSLTLDQRFGACVQRTITGEQVRTYGERSIMLRHWPVASVSSCVEYDSAGSSTTLSAEDYDTKPADGYRLTLRRDASTHERTLERRSGTGASRWPVDGVALVTYSAGRFADTSGVDARFKRAAAVTLQNIWAAYLKGNAQLGDFVVPQRPFPSFAVPDVVSEMLADELDVERFGGIG
jgi:hypothetical protein